MDEYTNKRLHKLAGKCVGEVTTTWLATYYANQLGIRGSDEHILNQAVERLKIKEDLSSHKKRSAKSKEDYLLSNKYTQPINNKEKRKCKPKKHKTDKEYWIKIRRHAIKVYGSVCMCCGITPKSTKNRHVDHIKPKKLYPELEYSLGNLQILCKKCNEDKSDLVDFDFRKEHHIRAMKAYCVKKNIEYLPDIEIPDLKNRRNYTNRQKKRVEKLKNYILKPKRDFNISNLIDNLDLCSLRQSLDLVKEEGKLKVEIYNNIVYPCVYIFNETNKCIGCLNKQGLVIREYDNWSNKDRDFMDITHELKTVISYSEKV